MYNAQLVLGMQCPGGQKVKDQGRCIASL